jgi:hypothetical protein
VKRMPPEEGRFAALHLPHASVICCGEFAIVCVFGVCVLFGGSQPRDAGESVAASNSGRV